jgi:hypothetical protein
MALAATFLCSNIIIAPPHEFEYEFPASLCFRLQSTLQVTSAILAGMVWALRHPRAGVVEAEDLDHASCLAIQRPYLGDLFGRFTDWTPLTGRVLSGTTSTGTGTSTAHYGQSAAASLPAANASKPASDSTVAAPASRSIESSVGMHVRAFPEAQIDASDPWQFRNVLLS